MTTRILALDVGTRRIGVAVSDALNITAQGLETIIYKDKKDLITRLGSLINEYDIKKIIIGMPFNMNGTKGSGTMLSEDLAALLKKRFPISIEMVDERLTTVQSERTLLDADISRKKRKAFVDKIAAQLILQAYLAQSELPRGS